MMARVARGSDGEGSRGRGTWPFGGQVQDVLEQ